jgi:hypothetical protein
MSAAGSARTPARHRRNVAAARNITRARAIAGLHQS